MLEDVLAAVLELPRSEITDELGPATLGSWTSLRHVQIVSAVQKAYQIRLSPREIRAIRTVGDLRSRLRAQGLPA